MNYKALIYDGTSEIKLVTKELRDLQDKEILVKVKYSGICKTDIHILTSGSGSTDVVEGTTLGHEFFGVVEKSTSNLFSVGEYVSVDPNMYCMKCEYCKKGSYHLCDTLEAYGVTQDGGFAQYAIVREDNVYKLKDDKNTNCLVEPISCCLHGLDLIDYNIDSKILIIGAGPIGLQMERLLQGFNTSIFDLDKKKYDNVFYSKKLDLVEQNKYDIVIECAGASSKTIESSMDAVTKGGTILVFSVPSGNIDFDMTKVFEKELTIKGSFINPNTYSRSIELINNDLNLQNIISKTYTLDEYEQAFLDYKTGKEQKVAIVFD